MLPYISQGLDYEGFVPVTMTSSANGMSAYIMVANNSTHAHTMAHMREWCTLVCVAF